MNNIPGAYQCMLLLKAYNYAYFKDVANLFLHAAALLPKDCAKDQDTLIEQSFICIYQQINGSAQLKDKISGN